MGIRLVGCVLLLLAGGYVTVVLTHSERRRMRVLDGFLSLLCYVKGQIDCYAMPIREILDRADPAVMAACRGFSEDEAESRPHVLLPAESMSSLVRESRDYLEPECERLLVSFSDELGGTFREEQVKRCEYYLEALGNERAKLADAIPVRIRVNNVLCVCGMLGLLVLLW